MNKNWVKQLSEAYIHINEVTANIRPTLPITSAEGPTAASIMKRLDLFSSASSALSSENHFINDANHPAWERAGIDPSSMEAMRTALQNHVSGNTQQDDLVHLVNFMKMDRLFNKYQSGIDRQDPWMYKIQTPENTSNLIQQSIDSLYGRIGREKK